jgi:hypothetical protein
MKQRTLLLTIYTIAVAGCDYEIHAESDLLYTNLFLTNTDSHPRFFLTEIEIGSWRN